jgi:hypothetical protein
MRLLARDPADRYPTATDARAALLGAGADDRAANGDETIAERVPGSPLPPPPPPGAGDGAPPSAWGAPTPGRPAGFAESERRWLVPTLLVVLVAVALGVAGLLLQGPGDGLFGDEDGPTDTTADDPEAPADDLAAIARSIDFDPQGGDGEHAEEAAQGFAFDNDPSTSWSSERYNSPDWGGLGKDGVGLIFELSEAGPLQSLEFDTPLSGWQAEVYVADEVHDQLDEWGEPVGTFDQNGAGTATADLDAEGAAVLLWFTRASDTNQVTVDEVRITR